MTDTLAKRLAALPPEQRALLEKQLRKKAAEQKSAGSIPAVPRTGKGYPLSYTQFRMWWLDQIETGNPAYIIPVTVRMRGTLDPAALERSLNECIRRHEALRTTFHAHGEQPEQQIHAALELPLPIVDLSGLPEEAREAEAQRIAVDEFRRPFALDELPLVRSMLVRLHEQEHLWLVAVHHIVFDGWSVGVLLQEVTALYRAYTQGQIASLPPLTVQPVDYAAWEQGQNLDKQLSYWKEQMSGTLPVLKLPTDFPRPSLPRPDGGQVNILLPSELHEALQELSRAEEATLFMTMMAAFQALLYRYAKQEEVIVGFPVSGRGPAEIHGVVGAFVNTLPLRSQVQAEMSFRELVRQVKTRTMGAFSNQDVPFEMLVEAVQPERRAAYSPLFQVLFNLNKSVPAVNLQNLSLEYELVDHLTSKFDLNLEVRIREDGYFMCTFEYNTHLFAEATVEIIAEQYANLLRAVVEHPGQRLADIELITEREQNVLCAMNDTARPYDLDQLLFEAFVKQAETHPERIALTDQGRSMTYGELHERSNQVAHFLRAHGVGRNQLVGILMERGLEMMVGLYGILKAGAAYVPIDPEYPAERIRYMLSDSGANVVLTKRAYVSAVSTEKTLLLLDEDLTSELDRFPKTMPAIINEPGDLAYMIYTSGSTGNPKGATISHRAIVNRLIWHQEQFQATPEDVIAQRTSVCFDVSVWELFWPLRHGAVLSILQSELVKDPQRMHEHLLAERVTVMHFVPSLFNVFVTHLDSLTREERQMPPLRWIVTSGEALPVKPVNLWFDLFPAGARIANLYGPTEAAIDVSCYVIEGPQTSIPIGQPIANTQLYVLDPQGAICPINMQGELHIGGVQLAEGYHNNPAKTAEAFLANHLPNTPGARLYRTGDLARVRPDGNIEYLGRIDSQVKVRGFRIELGEIEEVLARHPDVTSAAVVIRPFGDDSALVAYFTADRAELNTTELRSYLEQKLPGYMIPSHFQPIEQMPLNPSGKIDRKALPAVEWSARPELGAHYEAPQTETERILAAIWADVLLTERVGRDDNFFELGGHSLMVTQIVSRVKQRTQAPLQPRDFFEHPTIRQLGALIDDLLGSGAQEAGIAIARAPHSERYPLSNSQKRLYFTYQLDPENISYNMPGTLHLRGELNLQAFLEAFRHLVARHDSLRTKFTEVKGVPMQEVQPALDFDLPVHDLTALPAAERTSRMNEQIERDQTTPFRLEEGAPLRAMMFVLGEQEHCFYLNMHHIISDGWSLGILTREVCALYERLAAGDAPNLPELDLQYVDYAVWQQEQMESGAWAEQERYWLETLALPLPELELPYDRPRPSEGNLSGHTLHFRIAKELTADLRRVANEQESSLFMVLFAAYAQVLYRQSEQDDLIIGVPIAGRVAAELEPLIGLFLNNLAIRLQFDGDESQADLIQRVKKQTLDAFQHQTFPFDALVEKINPERRVNRSPIFSTMFNLQNAPLTFDLPGVEVKLELGATEAVKFDMRVSMTEQGDELTGEWNYCTNLFDRSTVEGMIEQFEQTLTQYVTDLDLPLVDGQEDEQLADMLGLFDDLE